MRKDIDKELDDLYELSNVLSSLRNVIEFFNKNGQKVTIVGI